MALTLVDLASHVEQLSVGLEDNGAVRWAGDLIQRLVDESGLDADVALDTAIGRSTWNAVVSVGSIDVALVDVVAGAERPFDRLDHVAAKASRRWRRVTRNDDLLRPWIGLAVIERTDASLEIRDHLQELIGERTLDAGLSITSSSRNSGGPLGLDSFAASLLGRLVYVRAVLNG